MDKEMTLNDLVAYFGKPKRLNSHSYNCICPVHNDKKQSLTISEEKGKLLIHCKARCETKDVLDKVGLTFKDIGNYKEPEWKECLEFAQNKEIQEVYNYTDEKGQYLYSKVRFIDKDMRIIRVSEDNKGYQYRNDKKNVLYRLPSLIRAIKDGRDIYIVEGEKDADTLNKMGMVATTGGGAGQWNKSFAKYFIGSKIIILPDNDEAGFKLRDRIKKDLKYYAHTMKIVMTSRKEHGDVTDYINEGHTKDELLELIKQEKTINAPWIYENKSGGFSVNADLLRYGVNKGLDYFIVRRPYDDRDDFYIYENGVYSRRNRNSVKAFIRRYIPLGLASDNLINNTYNLLLCSDEHICDFEELNQDEHYINLENGLYNVKTKQLEEHTPKLLSTLQLKCKYEPDNENKPTFDRFMNDLCRDNEGNIDEEKKAVIQEFTGFILSNVKGYRLKLAMVLLSLLGNTGKTQYLNLIINFLGRENVVNVPIQDMNEKSKFSMGSIAGKRLISIGDQTSSEIKDSAIFKQLTGGDMVKVEEKGKQPYFTQFGGGVFLACNNLPSFTDDKGGHLFERLKVIPCTNVIEVSKRDSLLLDKMLREKSAIFNWALEGLHRLVKNNYKVSKSKACEEALSEYREKLDTVYRFISEHENYTLTDKAEDRVIKREFDDEYIEWCMKQGITNVSKQNIKERMEKNGCPTCKGRALTLAGEEKQGVMVYKNIKRVDDFRTMTEKEQEELPFKADGE